MKFASLPLLLYPPLPNPTCCDKWPTADVIPAVIHRRGRDLRQFVRSLVETVIAAGLKISAVDSKTAILTGRKRNRLGNDGKHSGGSSLLVSGVRPNTKYHPHIIYTTNQFDLNCFIVKNYT